MVSEFLAKGVKSLALATCNTKNLNFCSSIKLLNAKPVSDSNSASKAKCQFSKKYSSAAFTILPEVPRRSGAESSFLYVITTIFLGIFTWANTALAFL